MLFENLACLGARRPVGEDTDCFLAAVLDRPIGDDSRLLAEREACAHVIRRALSHDRGPRNHHNRRDLGLSGERRHGHSSWCRANAEESHFVLDDQLLGEALTVIGHAGIIPDDQLDLLAYDCVAVLLNV